MKPLKIMMLGAPGAGKGTQARLLAKRYGIPQISTGDMLRAALAKKTPMGLEAQKYMDSGKLVPDEVVIEIVSERLKEEDAQKGFILDGFPRTVGQADALSKYGVELDFVFNIVVSDTEVVKRLSGRRTCESCGTMFHIHFEKPKVEGKCDVDGSPLIQRADDNADVIQDRLKEYEVKTAPLIEHYRKCGNLVDIDGEQECDRVQEAIVQKIDRVLS